MRLGVCVWLAKLLRIKRPGTDLSCNCKQRTSSVGHQNNIELHEYNNLASRSLLTNIKDEDDYSLPSTPHLNGRDFTKTKLRQVKIFNQYSGLQWFLQTNRFPPPATICNDQYIAFHYYLWYHWYSGSNLPIICYMCTTLTYYHLSLLGPVPVASAICVQWYPNIIRQLERPV